MLYYSGGFAVGCWWQDPCLPRYLLLLTLKQAPRWYVEHNYLFISWYMNHSTYDLKMVVQLNGIYLLTMMISKCRKQMVWFLMMFMNSQWWWWQWRVDDVMRARGRRQGARPGGLCCSYSLLNYQLIPCGNVLINKRFAILILYISVLHSFNYFSNSLSFL